MHSDKNGYGAPPQVVVHSPPVTVVAGETPFSACHLVTSAISLFCCQCFGLAALILSLMSYTDHRSKDFARYKSRRSTALGLAIAAIVLGSLAIIAAVVINVIFISATASYWQNYADEAAAAGDDWGGDDWGNDAWGR